MLLTVSDETVKREDAWRDKIMRFKEIQVLQQSALHRGFWIPTNIMVNARLYILTSFSLLLDEACCETSASRIDYSAAFLSFDRGM